MRASSAVIIASLAVAAGGAGGGCSAGDARDRGPGAATTTGGNGGSGSAGGQLSGGTLDPGPVIGGAGFGGSGITVPPAADAGTSDPNACGEHHFNLVRKPAELLLVLDRSKSMQDPPKETTGPTKWEIVRPAISQVITETNAAVSWGMKTFPEGEGSECVSGSVTSKIDVAVATANAPAVTTAVDMTSALGNGTPTGDAIRQAATYLKGLKDDNPKYILLATDGDPSCPKSGDPRGDAVAAVSEAAKSGVHTFVVGVATGKSSTTTLNDLAVAGLEPRSDPNPLATKYYLANTQADLVTSLKVITGEISNCIFTWAEPPPVPNNIAVKVGGVKADQDATNGWAYTGPDYKGVIVHGSACDKIKSSAGQQVEIIFGCPSVPIQ